jgi:hypothetical protein
LHPSKSQRVQPIDYSDVVVGFKQVTGRLAETPANLPTTWKATSRSLTHKGSYAHLHIGFVAPDSKYAALEEATGNPNALITSVLGTKGLTQTGTTMINGETWSERTSQRGETSLVRASPRLTVVITGSTAEADQRALAASLQPRSH